MTPLQRIAERVNRVGDLEVPGTPFPLLRLVEFFEGNDVDGSICCNVDSVPRPADMWALLRKIEDREDVDAVYVQVTMFDDPAWPFSDTVWVVTSCSEKAVAEWFPEDLRPNEVWEGWIEGQNYESVPVPQNMRPIACWWD
jgi:hypothetical protein